MDALPNSFEATVSKHWTHASCRVVMRCISYGGQADGVFCIRTSRERCALARCRWWMMTRNWRHWQVLGGGAHARRLVRSAINADRQVFVDSGVAYWCACYVTCESSVFFYTNRSTTAPRHGFDGGTCWRLLNELCLSVTSSFLDQWPCFSYRTRMWARPMPNVMADLANIGGALSSTPRSLADAHY